LNVETNAIAERAAGALNRRAAGQTDAVVLPFSRWHSVDAEVGVAEAIEPVPLNFRKTWNFVALGAVQRQCAIIDLRHRSIACALVHWMVGQ